jgi:CelD/BcsL family acetyltransferase involved in cellulose biosynthesis
VVSVIERISELDGLREEWDRLLARAREASPFLSWDWQQGWWRCYGGDHLLRLYAARRAGCLVGLLPLYQQRMGTAGFGYNRLRLVGTGGDTSPDYLGALLEPEGEETTARCLVERVLDDVEWDVLSLSEVREGSTLAVALREGAAKHHMSVHAGPMTSITVVSLPETWEEFLSTAKRHVRQEIVRRRRRMEELGARCYLWRDPSSLDRAIDRLAALHRLRWSSRTRHHAFSSPEYLDFHREVMHRFFRRGWLRLLVLEIGEEIVAMRYCFRFRDEVFAFQSGFDPAYGRLGPGSVLMGHLLENSIGEGVRRVDMLKGDYPHKRSWSREHRTTTRLRVYRRTLGGLLRRLREQELPAAWHFFRPDVERRRTVE